MGDFLADKILAHPKFGSSVGHWILRYAFRTLSQPECTYWTLDRSSQPRKIKLITLFSLTDFHERWANFRGRIVAGSPKFTMVLQRIVLQLHVSVEPANALAS